MLLRHALLVEYLVNLPYPIVLLWILWAFFVPAQIAYIFRRNQQSQLAKTGELMNFREVAAVGCIGGFILLTFITAFSCYLTFQLAGLIS